MKKLKLTKVIAGTLVVGLVLVLNPIGASAEWKQNNTGWWYTEGNSWSVGWKEIDGKYYYFGQDGYMVHDTTIDGCNIGSDGTWIQSNTQTEKNQTLNSFDVNVSIKYNIHLDDKVKDVNPNIIKATRQAMFDADCYCAKLEHYNGYSVNNDVLIFDVKEAGTDTWEVDFYEKKLDEKEYDTSGYSVATVEKQKDGSYTGGLTIHPPVMPAGETY
jgi:hypothetical protein